MIERGRNIALITPTAAASEWMRLLPPAANAAPTRPSHLDSGRVELRRATVEIKTALEEAAAAAAAAAQRALDVAVELDEALAQLERPRLATPVAWSPPDSWPAVTALTPREREVLALVAAGQSNKAIAAALFVSTNTVKTHVASLLHKLRVQTRVQLAAIAARGGVSQDGVSVTAAS